MLNEYLLSVIENVFHQVNINKSFINFIRRAHTLPSTLVTRETNVINNNYSSAQGSFILVQIRKTDPTYLLAKLNREATSPWSQSDVFPSYDTSSLREGVQRVKRWKDRRMEWAKRKEDVWERWRKELTLFDLGFLMLTNCV